jgi:hypothetical protein
LCIGVPLGLVALSRRMPLAWPAVGVVVIAMASGALNMGPHWIYIGLPGDAVRSMSLASGLLTVYVLLRGRLQQWAQ